DVPLHPRFTYLWHDIEPEEYRSLAREFEDASDDGDGGDEDEGTVLDSDVSPVLEKLLVPHTLNETDAEVRIDEEHRRVLDACLSTDVDTGSQDPVEAASRAAGVEIRERAPTRIGARMGRPEKSEEREMN
ncbi:MAG: DNA polymerase II large subunit, partial [Halobacteria archaeon]|nr:DNA polymerase II large subunit [Halobacteria archaeon]